MAGGLFFRKVGAKTRPSWFVKVLVWTLPALFILTTITLAYGTWSWTSGAVKTTGTVVSIEPVYEDREAGTVLEGYYLPRFSYVNSDGETVEALLSVAGEAFDFEIGSEHPIYYDPVAGGNVRLTSFIYNYTFALAAAVMAAMSTLIAFFLWVWIKSIGQKRDEKEQS